MSSGTLISFEGIDGCGKTTQLFALRDALVSAGADVLVLREPGGTDLGERVRDLLLDPQTGDISPAAESLLYAASRAELIASTIEPVLANGSVVLMDRYVDSSLAYQGAGRGLGIDRVLEANLLATGGRLPDQTIYVAVTPELAQQRLTSASEAPDRLEAAGREFFERVYQAYEQLAQRFPERIIRIDGEGSLQSVGQQVHEALSPVFEARGVQLPEPQFTNSRV